MLPTLSRRRLLALAAGSAASAALGACSSPFDETTPEVVGSWSSSRSTPVVTAT